MSDDLNIDELLNGYIDGELTPRQQVELKRLLNHDEAMKKRLNRLLRCKEMVNALPKQQAPPNMLRDIKLQLEGKTLREKPASLELPTRTKHAVHPFYRSTLKIAAMIALLAVLVGVIYTIMAPSDSKQKIIADPSRQDLGEISLPKTSDIAQVTVVKENPRLAAFNGKILLTTDSLLPLDAFINRTIVELGLLSSTRLESEKNRSIFDINCSQDELEKLLAQLGTIWQKCDSKTLHLYAQQFPDRVTVPNVTTRQILQIAQMVSTDDQIKTAKDYSSLNRIKASLSQQTLYAAMDAPEQFSFSIPKPVLASVQTQTDEQDPESKGPQNMYFTIVIQDSK
ncbi:MAG: anti-sigma factor family protein [Planctomycetota bacterium]|jgi:hypothetical protein